MEILKVSLTVVGAIVLLSGAEAWAQGTPDGETPANEGVCDDLIGRTPALYGLCVGFCEAQDCEATIDATTGKATFGPDCKPSSPKLLENYNKRAQPGDPPMPCVNVVAGECPCWTEDEARSVGTSSNFCRITEDIAYLAGYDSMYSEFAQTQTTMYGNSCYLVLSVPKRVTRFQQVTYDEFLACHSSISRECDARNLP